MPAISGKQVIELLQEGQVQLSDDGRALLHEGDVVARRVAFRDGVGYFEPAGDDMAADCVQICLSWEFDPNLKIKVCAELGCKE